MSPVDLIAAYGPMGVPLAIIGGLVYVLIKRETGTNGRSGGRISLADLRQDIHELRDLVQAISTRQAINATEITSIKERLVRECPLFERGRP